jgi:hypothetical protein
MPEADAGQTYDAVFENQFSFKTTDLQAAVIKRSITAMVR